MQFLFNIIIALALLFVVVILGLGLWNMVKGGSDNTSQRLMRLRVAGQAVAVLLLLAALLLFGSPKP
ncbi:MAG TPA: twin transmembrane helix small protein [Devosia sp.]|nr:twin transmembrane helix small protein [Devosia sp.]